MGFLVIETFILMAVFVALGIGLGFVLREIVEARAPRPGTTVVLGPAEPPVNGDHDPDHIAEFRDDEPDDDIIDPTRAAAADQVGVRPAPLTGPRDGVADDLKLIRGIGPQSEARLNSIGIYHLDQIAGWSPEEARWIGTYLSFPGRIEREDWIGQADRIIAGQ
jgi:predicted flap endonuclease-1-like 5' DNA nuclease